MRIWRGLLGVVWLGVAAWVWVTRGGVLLAGHPAYPVVVVAVGLVGVLLVGLAVRGPDRARVRRPWLRRVLHGAMAVVTVVAVGGVVYLRPFGATGTAVRAMAGTAEVRVSDSRTRITLRPGRGDPTTGLVFQPGARVDPRAYVPLLGDLARRGYLVVVVKQPFDIAFAAVGAPGGIVADHPHVEHWVVGGHSLGGVAASSYADDHDVDGLLLWASYPLDRVRDDLAVTSVSGTEDGLATPADLAASRSDLPADTDFVAVEGGVHAFFGDYGPQPGDGKPTVSRTAAQRQIVAASLALLARVG